MTTHKAPLYETLIIDDSNNHPSFQTRRCKRGFRLHLSRNHPVYGLGTTTTRSGCADAWRTWLPAIEERLELHFVARHRDDGRLLASSEYMPFSPKRAARAHTAAGRESCYSEDDTPERLLIKEHPDGRRELAGVEEADDTVTSGRTFRSGGNSSGRSKFISVSESP